MNNIKMQIKILTTRGLQVKGISTTVYIFQSTSINTPHRAIKIRHSGWCHFSYTDCHYAECRYAECRYAECQGAKENGLEIYFSFIYPFS